MTRKNYKALQKATKKEFDLLQKQIDSRFDALRATYLPRETNTSLEKTVAEITLCVALIAAFTTAIFTAFPPSAWFKLF